MTLKTIGYGAAVVAAALVIGWSGASQAKGKKAAAPPPPTPIWCMFNVQEPVCAKGAAGTMTYANFCFAQKEGATIIAKGACKPAKAGKKMKMKM